MTQFNRDGFVLMAPGGHLTWDSMVSAYSGKRVSPGGVLVPVPDADGLFVRLLPREARQLTRAEREAVFARARAWAGGLEGPHLEMFPDGAPLDATDLAETPPDDAEIEADTSADEMPQDLAALTLEQLRALAREVDLPGRSTMSKDELVAALADLDKPDTGEDEEHAP